MFTVRAEEALRLLAKRRLPLPYLERRFDLETGSLAQWLEVHNGGRKELTEDTVTRVKMFGAKQPVSLKAAPEVKEPEPTEQKRTSAAITEEKAPEIKPPAKEPALTAPPPNFGEGPGGNLERWMSGEKGKVVGQCTTLLVEVTPALATRWLLLNRANRIPSRSKIRRFAAAMKEKRWPLTGETIKFSISGRLLDGQSRLMAVVLAGVNVVLELRSGLPEAAQKSMDIGEARKGTHTLEMMGEKYPLVLAPALKLIWLLEGGNLGGQKIGQDRVLENFLLPQMIEKHGGLKPSVGWVMTTGSNMARMMAPGMTAFFHYIFGKVDPELRDSFFEALLEGVGLTKANPVYHLRERLISDRADGTARIHKFNLHRALMVKAFNATRKSQKVASLSWQPGEDFPEIDGLEL